jgi:hypothetical protein
MVDESATQQNFFKKRKIGLIAVALFYVVQTLYAYFLCQKESISGFWLVSSMVLLPGVLVFINWQTNRGLTIYTGILFAFCLWANTMECRPSNGGGAAMAYVVVMLFGWPLGLLIGVLVAKAADKNEET